MILRASGGTVPHVVATDRLRSYRAVIKVIGYARRQETGRWLNNRAEYSPQWDAARRRQASPNSASLPLGDGKLVGFRGQLALV
jgi:transposase-like protein